MPLDGALNHYGSLQQEVYYRKQASSKWEILLRFKLNSVWLILAGAMIGLIGQTAGVERNDRLTPESTKNLKGALFSPIFLSEK